MVYQEGFRRKKKKEEEGFRDPGQKSGFDSSQSPCPAPQWVTLAASFSRKVSMGQPSSCPFAHTRWWLLPWEAMQGHFGLHTIP